VDYATYAEGEAVLGWLNASISLSGNQVDWNQFAVKFLNEIGNKVKSMNLSVGHIKIIVQNGTNYLVGNITNDSGFAETRGNAANSDQAQMIVNARVGLPPHLLEKLVRESLIFSVEDKINFAIKAWKCISPGYPNPTYRYSRNF